jgi:hypothetical protein
MIRLQIYEVFFRKKINELALVRLSKALHARNEDASRMFKKGMHDVHYEHAMGI